MNEQKYLRTFVRGEDNNECEYESAPTVLVVGPSGAGKSTTVRYLIQREPYQPQAELGESVDTDFNVYRAHGGALWVVDTPGLQDADQRFTDDEIMTRLRDMAFRLNFPIKAFIVCTTERENRADAALNRLYQSLQGYVHLNEVIVKVYHDASLEKRKQIYAAYAKRNMLNCSWFVYDPKASSCPYLDDFVARAPTAPSVLLIQKPGRCSGCDKQVPSIYADFSECRRHATVMQHGSIAYRHTQAAEHYHPGGYNDPCIGRSHWTCCDKGGRWDRGCRNRYPCCGGEGSGCQAYCSNCNAIPQLVGCISKCGACNHEKGCIVAPHHNWV